MLSRTRHALIAAVATFLSCLAPGPSSSAILYTGLEFVEGEPEEDDRVQGISQTDILYGEYPDEMWCYQWVYWEGIQVCVKAYIHHCSAGQFGQLYSPSGPHSG